MCMQCMAAAMTTGAAATGLRAWLATHRPTWMTARHLSAFSGAILVAAVIGAGTIAA